MTKIYTLEDKIPVSIDDLTFFISPLKYSQKTELQSLMNMAITSSDIKFAQDAAFLAIKYAVKEVHGIKKQDGTSYAVTMENGILNDDSVDNLLNIEHSTKLAVVCSGLINGISKEVLDPYTGDPLEGVSFGESEKKD